MLLQPKNRKYRKDQKGSKNQKTVWKRKARSHRLSFGSFGLKSLEANWLKASQLEAVRKVIIRDLRKIGKIWIRTFPHKPAGRKPAKTRMGKGKGSVQFWVCPINPGQILFEINGGISKEAAKQVLERAGQKLPVNTQFTSYTTASWVFSRPQILPLEGPSWDLVQRDPKEAGWLSGNVANPPSSGFWRNRGGAHQNTSWGRAKPAPFRGLLAPFEAQEGQGRSQGDKGDRTSGATSSAS